MAERNYYMVRAMGSTKEDFDVFFNKGNEVAAVGWSEVNFTEYPDINELRKTVDKVYYEGKDIRNNVRSRKLNQVTRFVGIKRGDYVLVPWYSDIAVGIVTGEHKYSERDYDKDLANQVEVTYLRDGEDNILRLPRRELGAGLQNRLRAKGNAVADFYEFKDEIEEIFRDKEKYSRDNKINKKRNERMDEFRYNLLRNIQTNRGTNLTAGGIGLEKLVQDLLICEGYNDVRILSKRTYSVGTDADIRAIRADSFVEDVILVQVKHHGGVDDKAGIEQLIKAMMLEEEHCTGIYVTSASSINKEAKELADLNPDINIVTGEKLVEIIERNLDKLSEDTKRTLGIYEVPCLTTD